MSEINNSTNHKTRIIVAIIVILILIVLIGLAVFFIYNLYLDDADNDVNEEIRFVDKNDITTSYEITKSSIVITIQANTNIESLSADIDILDKSGNIIDSKNVKYSKMQSGSKYEVTFYLSEDKLEQAYRYNVHDIDGILES